jgi:glycosyltransferase involved in cell wall biosynthesis
VRVLVDYRPALRERSGAGEYTHQLVRALMAAFGPSASNGALELTVFSSSWKHRLTNIDQLDGVKVIDRRIPVKVLNLAWHRFGWPPAELVAGRGFDVMHSSHPLLMPTQSAAQVITIHDLNFLAHPERTRAEIRRDYPALVHAHARRADAIIVPSHFTAREVEHHLGVDAARISVCPPGAPDWSPRDRAPDNGYILFFGTLEPRKNVGGLLDAYERLLQGPAKAAAGPAKAGHYREGGWPELVLAGRATDESRPWLDRIARAPLAGRVRHIGYVNPADRQALYSGARLLVQPSFEEGFGIPVLEAMTFGVPVVAAARGSLPEVLGNAGPLVEPDDPFALAAAIARILDDEGYAAACVQKGVQHARSFKWHETAQRVYDTYQRAIEHRRCGSA